MENGRFGILFRGCVVSCCLFSIFVPLARPQNVTLSWPDAPAKQPDAPAKPPDAPAKKANATPVPTPKTRVTSHPSSPNVERPTDGSISGNTYTNNFFHFSLPFPEGWKVLGNDVALEDMNKGDILLLVGWADRQTHGFRSIVISANVPPSTSGSITAMEFLKREADATTLASSMNLLKDSIHWQPTEEPTEISIGGKRMARLEMRGPDNSVTTQWSQLAIIDRGYFVLFQFMDLAGNLPGTRAGQTINSLHFFENAH